MNTEYAFSREARIVKLLQGYDVDTGKATSAVLLRLPTGDLVTADVERPVYNHLLMAYGFSKPEEPADEVATMFADAARDPDYQVIGTVEHAVEGETPPAQPERTPEEEAALDQEVSWAAIPDETLDPLVKTALRVFEFPPVMTIRTLDATIDDLHQKLSEADWKRIALQLEEDRRMQQGAPPAPVAPVAPPEPTWADGSPITPTQRNSGRTVQADERGNPVTNTREVDPGELVAGDDDGESVPSW